MRRPWHAGAQPHPQAAPDQVRGLGQAGPALTVRGARQQHREDLLTVLAPERPGMPRQQPPVPSLELRLSSHVAAPLARFSRVTRALTEAGALADHSPALDEVRQAHNQKYPRLNRLRLHQLWTGLPSRVRIPAPQASPAR